ncbi:hypothetical protein BHU11_01020 [Tannerella sp. oral taxon 808]|nr:hypothetical protein BHU11_01020 [Tannerella sp. oral taxon 808]
MKKTFWADFLRLWREKNFFAPFPEALARKKLFEPIVSYNGAEKTFWADCLVQWHEKNFLGRLLEALARKKLFELIVSYNGRKKTFWADCLVQWPEKTFLAIVSYNDPRRMRRDTTPPLQFLVLRFSLITHYG